MKNRCISLRFKTFILVLLLLGGLSLTGCVSSGEHSFRVQFHYPYSGVGGQNVFGRIKVTEGAEQEIISRAIIDALQYEEFGIVKPELEPGVALPTGKYIETDDIPLNEWLHEHNENVLSNPKLNLPIDRGYRLKYVLKYNIVDKEFYFKVNAILTYKMSRGHKWRKYNGCYSGAFFVDKLEDRIRAILDDQEN